jgi:hypothetical protein
MVKNKKRKKPSSKKKQNNKSVSLSKQFDLHSRINRRRISIFKKIVTKQRIYIFVAVLVLLIVASTASYALNNTISLIPRPTKPTSTSNNDTNDQTQATSSLSDKPISGPTITSPHPTSCYEINAAAEAQYLKSTSVLVYPHYGDARAVFDAYNNGYRQAYNTYLNTVRPNNCPVTISDRGTVQYASPTCTQAYSDKIVAVLRNQIISVENLDMNVYNDWKKAGHHSSWDPSYQSYASYQSDIANEQNLIQSQDNANVRDYVSKTNNELKDIFCPALNPSDFYTHMF